MKLRDIPVLLTMFAATVLTSCGIGTQLSNGNTKYNNQIGANGVRRMADPDNKTIKNAVEKAAKDSKQQQFELTKQGLQSNKTTEPNMWQFHQSPRHPQNGYIYSRSVELSKKQEIFFRYNVLQKQMDVFAVDPTALDQAEASTTGVTYDIKRDQFQDANIEPLFDEAEKLAAQLGPTVGTWPRLTR